MVSGRIRFALLTAAAFVGVLGASGTAYAVSPNLVISQIYGGGGNTGAPLTHDYIELYNRSLSTVPLDGLSLQYTSAAGTGNFGSATNQLTPLSGSLGPGQYLLVREAPGASTTGTPVATDIDDDTPIPMGSNAGKVALVTGVTGLGCNGGSAACTPDQLARIIDLVGYGNANFFEGSGPAPLIANDTADYRGAGGCNDTDNNAADFAAAAPSPRSRLSSPHFCEGDNAPGVSSTTPANGASGVAVGSNVTVTFSENVDTAGNWYTISCGTSGAHTAVASGGPQTFTLDPDTDFVPSETCTVTITASQVTDQDVVDPPNEMAANYVFSFQTLTPPPLIGEIQGAAHISPKSGQTVSGVLGIVTAKRTLNNSAGFWMQDGGDGNNATSDGIFVFTRTAPAVNVGDLVSVNGSVSEFRPGGAAVPGLTITQLNPPIAAAVSIISSGNPTPAPKVIGTGGLIPPTEIIDNDSAGNVETGPTLYDPQQDGIDFWESHEGELLQANNGVVVNETESFGEVTVLPDNGAWATGTRTPHGGILAATDYSDFNPERFVADDEILRDQITPRPAAAMPLMNVGDHVSSMLVGPLDYSFNNYKIQQLATPTFVSGGLQPETTQAPVDQELLVGTFNVENLDPGDGPLFDRLAGQIVNNLSSPDILGIEEIQDNNGVTNNGVVDASQTWQLLIEAITRAGGPLYDYRQIDPVNNADGGAPGGNIRIGFLFRTDRDLKFIDRPGGTSTNDTAVVSKASGPELTFSPGRLGTSSPSFAATRKPLVGEFKFRGKELFVMVNHFSSKTEDQPLVGRFQPPARLSEVARHGQAQVVNDFMDELLAADPNANAIVLGDINDFEFSETVEILEGGGELFSAIKTLPANERYSYVFEGNSQVLDQILLSPNIYGHFPYVYDVVHVNSEFATQASDHEPSVVLIRMIGRPTP
ncbi:MAG TPA: Ig-like domain-containing protein [Gaiellaceae bacterium]|nr:Ig-like domain-containing protein [Gaiellaceae bacterium]